MLETIFRYFTEAVTQILSAACQMNMTHWSIAATALIVVGAFCMRGLGSRKNY